MCRQALTDQRYCCCLTRGTTARAGCCCPATAPAPGPCSDFYSEFQQALSQSPRFPGNTKMVVLSNRPSYEFNAFQARVWGVGWGDRGCCGACPGGRAEEAALQWGGTRGASLSSIASATTVSIAHTITPPSITEYLSNHHPPHTPIRPSPPIPAGAARAPRDDHGG